LRSELVRTAAAVVAQFDALQQGRAALSQLAQARSELNALALQESARPSPPVDLTRYGIEPNPGMPKRGAREVSLQQISAANRAFSKESAGEIPERPCGYLGACRCARDTLHAAAAAAWARDTEAAAAAAAASRNGEHGGGAVASAAQSRLAAQIPVVAMGVAQRGGNVDGPWCVFGRCPCRTARQPCTQRCDCLNGDSCQHDARAVAAARERQRREEAQGYPDFDDLNDGAGAAGAGIE
jgi:hypothetical protein